MTDKGKPIGRIDPVVTGSRTPDDEADQDAIIDQENKDVESFLDKLWKR